MAKGPRRELRCCHLARSALGKVRRYLVVLSISLGVLAIRPHADWEPTSWNFFSLVTIKAPWVGTREQTKASGFMPQQARQLGADPIALCA